MDVILGAIGEILSFKILLIMSVACVAGLTAGALPGFTAVMAVALLVPFTFTMTPVAGLAALGTLYCATIFGGSFTAILINTPGTPSSIATTFDGYPMARQGRGEEAVYTATIASGVGGLFGWLLLVMFTMPLASVALRFGPPEYFWVAIFGLTIIASIASKSLVKGLTSGLVGMVLSLVGIAPIGGDVRFDFGVPSFQGGIELIPILIGFFCIPEMIKLASSPEKSYEDAEEGVEKKETGWVPFKKACAHVFGGWINTVRSSMLGALIGVLPGAGGTIAGLLAYNEAKRVAKDPETFGTGNPQGIVATESANNAVCGGALIPLLALGVPGSPPAAIIYGALLLQGLTAGPKLFTERADITYAFFFSFFLANILMCFFGILVGRYAYKTIMRIPTRILIPTILLLTVLGSYAINNNVVDVIVMFFGGLLGFVMREMEFDGGALVLGLILGPIAETGFVQGLIMGNKLSADAPWVIFFSRPLSIILIILCVLSAMWPLVREFREKRKLQQAGGAS